MKLLVKILMSKKLLIMIVAIMIFTFSFLLFRSITKLNDHQCYLNDLNRLKELNEMPIDTRRLTVNPYDLSQVIDTFRNQGNTENYLMTESINAAFFYNKESNSVELERIRDLIDHIQENHKQTIDGKDYHSYLSPEEIFGRKLIYLGSRDGVLSEAIETVRSTARNSMDFGDYEQQASSLEDDFVFSSIFNPVDTEVFEAARIILDRFHPERTLFVNDSSWKSEADELDAVEGIVFANDIETIPPFDLDIAIGTNSDRIRLLDLDIPSSVKRIESDAFPKEVFDILTLEINSLDNLFMENDSLTGVKEVFYDIPLFQDDNTIDFSDDVDFELDPTNGITYSFGDMTPNIQQYGLNGYNVIEDGSAILIEFYANDFLIGFARNTYITNYYIDRDAGHPYHIGISSQGTFHDVESPQKSGYTFNGWRLGDEPITDGDGLPNKTVNVYADWIEAS